MYQEAMKAFLGGQEGLDYFKAVGDQAQLVAEFTRKSATQLQYTKYMIIAQLIALLIEAAVAAATAFFFGASIGAYLQKQAIVRVILKTRIGRMIVTLLTHQVINVGMGVTMDAMIQWIQLNQGTRDEWDTDLTKNAALSGMVQGLLAGPFNALGDRFGKMLAKMFGLDSGRNLGNKIDGVVPPPKNRPDVDVKVPPGKPDVKTPAPSPSPSPKPKTESAPGATVPKPGDKPEVPETKPKPGDKPEAEKPDPKPDTKPPVSFGRDMSEAFRKNLPNTYGPNGAKAGDKFVKDVGEVFRRQYGDGAVGAGRDWARALLEKTGTRELPDALEKALGPIAKDLGPDAMKVLSQGAADSMGRSIMREIVEGTGRGIFEGAHAAVSEGMYNLIFSDEHTFKTSGLTFASGMVEGRLGAMMETGGENLAMGMRGNLGMAPPSWLTEGGNAPSGAGSGGSGSPAAGSGAQDDAVSLASQDDGDDADTISLLPLDDDDDDTASLASLDDKDDKNGEDDKGGANGRNDNSYLDDFDYTGDGSELIDIFTGAPMPPPVTTAPVPTTGSPSPTATQTPNQTNQQTNQSTQNNQPSNQTPPRTTQSTTDTTTTTATDADGSAKMPTTLSTESTTPDQDQNTTTESADDQRSRQENDDRTDPPARPLTESTTLVEDFTTEAPRTGDSTSETDSRTVTAPATVSNEDVPKSESEQRDVNTNPAPRTVDATTTDTTTHHTSPRPNSETETAAARTGEPDSESVPTPLHTPSFSPPKNDPDEGAGAQHTRGTSSASALQSGDGVMSLKQFQDATSSTGFRSKSEIGRVDEALRQFKSLGNARAMDQLLALSRIVRECDTYVNHKGDKGTVNNRVLGTQQLSDQAKAQKAQMASTTLFRDLLAETDRVLDRGENPDRDNRVLGGEAQGVARALTGDEFKTLMDGYVEDLRALQDDPTLPDITRNVIQELMDVVPLVTVMEYPKTGNPGMKFIPGGDAPSTYSFNVDTQARGGTSFLLGHMAHEFTHVAAHRAFSSSAVMELVRSDSTDQQVRELAAERKQTLEDLNSAREGNPAFGDFQQNMLQEKLVYGSQPYKLARYATNFGATGKITSEEKARLLRWDEAAGDASGTLVEYDTVLNQMLVYLHMWGTAPENTFYTKLREAAETAYQRRENSRQSPIAPPTVPTTSGSVPSSATPDTETNQTSTDTAAPVHFASSSPPKNDPVTPPNTRHTREMTSASMARSGDGMMSVKQFQESTSASGLRSKSEISKVDTALREFHRLPANATPHDRVIALKAISDAGDLYIEHKGDGGGTRTEGVKALVEQARVSAGNIGEPLFRNNLGELDRLLSEGALDDALLLATETQHAAQAMLSDRFHSMMSEFVQQLGALRSDESLPPVTRRAVDELMAVEPLVTVMQFPHGAMPGMKLTSDRNAAPTYTFNVNVAPKGGTSYLLGHIAHEFTHIAAHQAFGGSPIMELIPAGATIGEVVALAKERTQKIADLKKAMNESELFGKSERYFLTEQLDYADKKARLMGYAASLHGAGKITLEEKNRLVAWDQAVDLHSGTLVEYDTVLNQMLVYLHMWNTPLGDPLYTRLREEADIAYQRREAARQAAAGAVTVPPIATTSESSSSTATTGIQTAQAPVRVRPPTDVSHPAGPVPSTTAPSTIQAPTTSTVPPTVSAISTPQQSGDRAALAYQLLTSSPSSPSSSSSSSSIPPAPTPPPVRSPEESAPAPLPTGKRPAPPVDPSLPRVPAERVARPATAEELAAFGDAAWAKVSTERFDPVRVQSNQRPGLLDGSATLIRHQVRREDLEDGRTVRHFRLDLPFRPLNGLGDADLRALETRLQSTLDSTVNSGYKLPYSGDQLRVTLNFRPDPDNGEAIKLTRNQKSDRANQIRWDLGHDDGTLVHELLHYLGLPDEYLDTRNGRRSENPHVFRSDERLSGVRRDGLMATAERADLDALPADYLKRIEEVSDTALIPTHTRDSSQEATPPRSSENTDGHNSPPLHPTSAIPPEVTPRLSEVLPRDDWWTLFFDPTDHETARTRHPDDPGSYYDNDESPGFREGMNNAYDAALENPDFVLDATSYEGLHAMAMTSLGYVPPRTGGALRTSYPLRSEEVSAEVSQMTIGDRTLLVDAQDAFGPGGAELFARARAAVSVVMPSPMSHLQVTANYRESDWSPLLNTIFAEYRAEIANSGNDRERMTAIAKTITKLQVMHPFQDGNRRVNVHVVLPRLLLENGFNLVMSPEMRSMFQGGTSLTRQVDILMGTTEQTSAAPAPGDAPLHPTSASPESNGSSDADADADPSTQPKPDDTRTLLEPAQKRVRDSSSTSDDDRDPPQRPRMSADSPPTTQEPQPDAPVAPEAGPGDASEGSVAAGSSSGPVTRKLSDILPESDWWRLFLDPVHHEEAQQKHPDDPGSYYDNDQSPGFRVGMLKAYKEALENPGFVLNSHTYESLHTKAVESLKKPPQRTQASPATMFPLRAKEMSEDTDKMTILGRKLLLDFKKYDWGQSANSPKPVSVLRMPSRFGNSDELITTNYKPEEWSDLLNAIFEDYGKEIDAAVDDRAKMAAIARVVTKLQIMHPFGDGNRRLNVHVILPRLLLENNFRPVISPDMKHMFQGGTDVKKQVDILMQSQI
ncbi:hypothetical protein ACWDR0_28415 [Streptomyces sp. NPDC003691]